MKKNKKMFEVFKKTRMGLREVYLGPSIIKIEAKGGVHSGKRVGLGGRMGRGPLGLRQIILRVNWFCSFWKRLRVCEQRRGSVLLRFVRFLHLLCRGSLNSIPLAQATSATV